MKFKLILTNDAVVECEFDGYTIKNRYIEFYCYECSKKIIKSIVPLCNVFSLNIIE